VYSLCTYVVGNSEASAAELRSFWRIPKRKIQVFWNTMADPGDRVPVKDRLDAMILCAGRLDPSKGQEVLLRALAQVRTRHAGAQVMLLGDGPERERLMRLATDLGIAQAVEFRGFVSHQAVVDAMARAAIVAVPSHDEAFGNTNMEALSVGTPVVASRVGGIPEVIRHGVDGLLFDRGDHAQMAECLNTLLDDDARRDEMGKQARKRFLEMFETSAVLDAQVRWFESLKRR
jgi:glycosyltransferase involved in cell wall biosynthesis